MSAGMSKALCLVGLVGAMAVPAAQAQSAADTLAVENAMATYLRPKWAGKKTFFDGSIIGVMEVDSSIHWSRDRARSEELARLIGARYHGLDEAIECPGEQAGRCRLIGADIAVRLGEPEFVYNSAYIWVYSRYVEIVGGAPHLTVSDTRYLLRRDPKGRWVVIRATEQRAA